MPSNNTQKVILITGTSSGFGLLFAARLASRGHFVYATMRDLNKQQALVDEVSKRGGQLQLRQLDVNNNETIKQVVDEIIERHNHIDVLINNAGYGLGGFFEDLSEEDIRGQMETNFFGVQRLCRQVLPHMRARQDGLIINISSIAGQTATLCLGAYNASKWALEGFSESLYYEVAPFGIKVVLVEPGSYPTNIFKENARFGHNSNNPLSPYSKYTKRVQDFIHSHTNNLSKDPEDVAALIERIINNRNPKLRYVSDMASWCRIMFSKVTPPWAYGLLYKKFIFKE